MCVKQSVQWSAEETYPSATMSTTNPTLPDLGSNLGSHGGKPVTNRLSYGTASKNDVTVSFLFVLK
jgi:hypothetical protein